MKVNSKVTINVQKIKQLTQAQIIALELTAEDLHTDVVQAQVVPRDTGDLQGDYFFPDYSESSKGKVQLAHARPYARRMYYHPEYDFQTMENPNAKGHWYEDWVDGYKKDFCKNSFKEHYKRLGGI